MRTQTFSLVAAFSLIPCFVTVATLSDSNFQETTYATMSSGPTGMAWAPDGSCRLFVTRKPGVVQVIKNGSVLPTPFATVSPITISSECGLIGICFDPNFIINGYVYLFVTVSSTEQQIIRYRAVGDVGTDKTTIISGLPTRGANHDGGSVGVGRDGKLYWAIGDLGNGTGVDGNIDSLAAKIGRANLDGSVPSDNPYVDGAGGTNDYIWARGFRNPYTFTFQPNTGKMWVNCVGTSYEQVFLVNVGDHAGYNDFENSQPTGYLAPKIKYRTNGTDTREVLPGTGAERSGNVVTFTTTTTHGFRQGERITIAGVAGESFDGAVYVASVVNPTTFTAEQAGPDVTSGGGTVQTLDQGGCVTGGCFFDTTAAPAEYRGNYFYGDLNSSRIMRATLNGLNEVQTVDYFANNISSPIDMEVGPDGAFYSVNYGGTVRRIAFTNHPSQKVVVTPTVAQTVEGGATAVMICLARPPASDVVVNTARTSGSTGIGAYEGATLTFTPVNWSVPQSVRILAAADANAANSSAQLSVSSSGLTTETLTVHAVDVASEEFSVGLVTMEGGGARVRVTGEPGRTYVIEANSSPFASWTPLFTNTLTGFSTNFLDASSVNQPARYYRARLLQ